MTTAKTEQAWAEFLYDPVVPLWFAIRGRRRDAIDAFMRTPHPRKKDRQKIWRRYRRQGFTVRRITIGWEAPDND